MYHYVRDLPRTLYPRIKGLLTERFEGQLDYISKHYHVCSLAKVVAAIRGDGKLPQNACVLTFDDGLIDHYKTVFPRLLDRRLTGAFFPSARPFEISGVLDVHKVQFILAATTDFQDLANDILGCLNEYRDRFSIPSADVLRKQFAIANRFDDAEVVLIKRLLQWALPQPVRSEVAREIFARLVTRDEAEFARDLYMEVSHLREMVSCGMEVGGHGYNHYWLGQLSREEQTLEIDKTVSFLENVFGRRPKDWFMCYPFGSYNSDTIDAVCRGGCAIGLTTNAELSDISRPLELSRLDTNDLPTAPTASIDGHY